MNAPQIIEYHNQRLLTTEQLADFYETTPDVIRQNFKRNKNKFKEEKHYFELQGDDLKELKREVTDSHSPINKFASSIIIYTKQGASRHSKILNTDKAWDMFDVLEENYFNPVQEQQSPYQIPTTLSEALRLAADTMDKNEELQKQIEADAPLVAFGNIVNNSSGAINIGQFAKTLYEKDGIKMGRNEMFSWLRDRGYLIACGRERNNPKQKYMEQGLFKMKPTIIARSNGDVQSSTTLITGKGQIRITSELKAEIEAKRKVEVVG